MMCMAGWRGWWGRVFEAGGRPALPSERLTTARLGWIFGGIAVAMAFAMVMRFTSARWLLDSCPGVEEWALMPRCWDGVVGILTSPGLHGSDGHLKNNLLVLVLHGCLAAALLGWRRYAACIAILWFSSGVIDFAFGVNRSSGERPTISYGASGVAFGVAGMAVVGALKRLWVELRSNCPDWTIAAALVAPATMAAWICGSEVAHNAMYVSFTEYHVMRNDAGAAVNWQAHIDGFLLGVVLIVLWKPKPYRLSDFSGATP